MNVACIPTRDRPQCRDLVMRGKRLGVDLWTWREAEFQLPRRSPRSGRESLLLRLLVGLLGVSSTQELDTD